MVTAGWGGLPDVLLIDVSGHRTILAPAELATAREPRAAPPWSAPPAIPYDFNGPADLPFDPPPDGFTEQSAFAWFEKVAARDPAATALADRAQRLTYAEVAARTRALAHLVTAATPPGRAVAVLLAQSPSAMVALLACLAAGRVCLLLNATHPAERNAAILRDAGVGAIILDADLGAEGAAHLGLDDAVTRIGPTLPDAPPLTADWPLPLPLAPDDPAVVLYTSGSTGRPKGIALSQRALLCRAQQRCLALHLTRGDRVLSLSPLCTVTGLVAGLAALVSGSLQFLMPMADAGNPAERVARERPTILTGLPALLRALIGAPDARRALADLRVVHTTGDRLLRSDVAAWRAKLPAGCHIFVTYGLTEVAVAASFVPHGFAADAAALPVGYPLADNDIAIIDAQGRPVADGEVGELVVRGRTVARGEWEGGSCVPGRMRPDPDDAACRIFHTGDLVRRRPDGMLDFVARRDRQIRVRGQRIEPAEIEDALRRLPCVADAAVIATGEGEATHLLAFVVPEPDSTAAPARTTALPHALRDGLRRQLPAPMLPERVILTGRIPLLPDGKLDAAALLALALASPAQGLLPHPDPAAPATRRARKAVARAWLRVLDRRSLRADLPFDEAGGDSLRLIRLIFELEAQCGISLELAPFSGDLRPSDMARALDRCLCKPADGDDAEAVPDVFLLPAIGGDDPRLVNFRALCRSALRVELVELGDWPELIAPGFDLSALVGSLAERIMNRAPAGPLRLAGWSYGGHLAVAVASALCEAGCEVAFLGILDTTTSPLTFADLVPQRRPTRMENLRQVPAWIRAGETANRLADFIVTRVVARPRLLRLAARRRHVWLPFGFGFHLNRRMGLRLRRDLLEVWRLRREPPPPLSVSSLVLFRAAETEPFAPDEVGWCAAYPDIRIVPVTGDHTTMLEPPHLATLCARFIETVLHTY